MFGLSADAGSSLLQGHSGKDSCHVAREVAPVRAMGSEEKSTAATASFWF